MLQCCPKPFFILLLFSGLGQRNEKSSPLYFFLSNLFSAAPLRMTKWTRKLLVFV